MRRQLLAFLALLVSLTACFTHDALGPSSGQGAVGSYILTHHNTDPVPAVIHNGSDHREVLVSGSIQLRADSTFEYETVERATDAGGGSSRDDNTRLGGRFRVRGDTVTFTVTTQNGQPGTAWELPATLTAGVLTVRRNDHNIQILVFGRVTGTIGYWVANYALASFNGKTPPTQWFLYGGTGLDVLGGSVTVRTDGTLTETLDLWVIDALNGAPFRDTLARSGRYTINGDTLTAVFEYEGESETVVMTLSAGNRITYASSADFGDDKPEPMHAEYVIR